MNKIDSTLHFNKYNLIFRIAAIYIDKAITWDNNMKVSIKIKTNDSLAIMGKKHRPFRIN